MVEEDFDDEETLPQGSNLPQKELEDMQELELLKRLRDKIDSEVQIKTKLMKTEHANTAHGKIINASYRTGYIPEKMSTGTRLLLDYVMQSYDLAVFFSRLEERFGSGGFMKVSEIFQSEIDGFLDFSVSIGGRQQKWFFEPKISKESTLREERLSSKASNLFGLQKQ